MSLLEKNAALRQVFEKYGPRLAEEEGLSLDSIREALEAGTMVLLGNPSHPGLRPILVGQPSRVKINANLGTSPLCNTIDMEKKKLRTALEAGTDTVMDLSTAGDLDEIRNSMLAECPLPLGTVPIYGAAQKLLDTDRNIEEMDPELLFAEIARQAGQGVDYMTVHCGVTQRGAAWACEKDGRILGIVSRGGALMARWMRENKKENPLLEQFDRLIEIAREHNVTLSLGDGLRPGAGADAGDAAQWEEVITLGRLARRALQEGVQCMIEGPGHVPLNEIDAQIRGIKKLTHGAPLYVLGPLAVDTAAGYDHISGAIGAAQSVIAGVDFLCYLTPAEHLTLPDENDVHAGVMASRIAAQAGEVALGVPRALLREARMSKARMDLDWKGMRDAALDPAMVEKRREAHKKEDVCAMCGKFCAMKMIRTNV